MSSLWTPGGEHQVPRESPKAPPPASQTSGSPTSAPADAAAVPPSPGLGATGEEPEELTDEEMQQHLAQLREQLSRTPVEEVVANLGYQLFELAALHLSFSPPQLDQARLAIDSLTSLVDGVGDRLGPRAGDLSDGLAQLRMFYVQVSAATQEPPSPEAG